MAASKTAICNSALIEIGGRLITDFDEDSVEANLCKEHYDRCRRALLYEHPWNFAIKRTNLAADVAEPSYGYDYQYTLPSDYIRILDVENAEEEWAVENKKILSNTTPLYLRYIADITETGAFSAAFDEVLALKMASDISYHLKQSVTLKDFIYKKYQDRLRMARSFDAQEGSVQRVYADQWLNSRY